MLLEGNMPTTPTLRGDLSNWFHYGSQAATEGDLRRALFSVSVIAALISQHVPASPPAAPVSEDELQRQEADFAERLAAWRAALNKLLGVRFNENGGHP